MLQSTNLATASRNENSGADIVKILIRLNLPLNDVQRFPKTLVFAANDLPHTSHADQLVNLAREVFGRGDAFVEKITGRVDRPRRLL